MKIRLMTVQRETTGEASAAHVLEVCGFSYDDVKKWGGSVEHTDFEAITNAIKDGRCDVFIQALSKGHPTFTELAVTWKINLNSNGQNGRRYGVQNHQDRFPRDCFSHDHPRTYFKPSGTLVFSILIILRKYRKNRFIVL